jgi:hypothetical protein
MRRQPRFMDKGLKGWVFNYARKNMWRMPSWIDLDDLISEGMTCYAICRSRYDDRVENKRHFMALVKICFINQITDLANQCTAEPEIAVSQLGTDDEENTIFEKVMGGMEGDAELAALLSGAPAEIKKLMALANSPEWADLMGKPGRRRAGGQRETTCERLGRLLDLPPGSLNIEEQVRRLLAGLTPNPEFRLIPHPARGQIRAWRAA